MLELKGEGSAFECGACRAHEPSHYTMYIDPAFTSAALTDAAGELSVPVSLTCYQPTYAGRLEIQEI